MQPTMCPNGEDAYRNIWNECVCENFDDSSFANFPDIFPSTSCFPSELPSCPNSSLDSQNTLFDPAIANDDVTAWLQSSCLDDFNFPPLDYSFNPELPVMSAPLFPSQKVAPQDYSSPTISAAELERSLSISGPNDAESSSTLSAATSLFSSLASSNTPLLASRRIADPTSVPSFSEEDSDGVTDNGDEGDASSDDEYMPSFRPSHRRSSSSGSFASRKAAMASVLRSSRSAPSHSPAGRPARSTRKRVSAQVISQRCKPRAKQVGASVPFEIPDDFHCRHCDFVQHNHRLQDFRRHVANHYRSIIYWTCCGVAQSDAGLYGLDKSNGELEVVERNGVKLVGGCGRQFGRKDAYKRHLDDPNNDCAGDIDAVWHPGNAYKDLD